VALCDAIWQVMLHSSVIGFPLRAILGFSSSGSGSGTVVVVVVGAAAVSAGLAVFCCFSDS